MHFFHKSIQIEALSWFDWQFLYICHLIPSPKFFAAYHKQPATPCGFYLLFILTYYHVSTVQHLTACEHWDISMLTYTPLSPEDMWSTRPNPL